VFPRRLVVLVVAGLVGAGLSTASPASAQPEYARISGSGSSWASNYVSYVQAELRKSGLAADFSPNGSSRGREDFADVQTDFAVSDLTYAEAGERDPARPFAYAPFVAGAIAFPYQVVVNGVRKQNIRLSGPTLAGIFSGTVTNWNDPTITRDNGGHQVAPDLPITPVPRADASAPSYRLTDWFSSQFPRPWGRFTRLGATPLFPAVPGASPKVGDDGVVNYIKQSYANGAIGYANNSYAVWADLPTAAVKNHAGQFVAPRATAVSLALRKAVVTASGQVDLHPLYTDTNPRSYVLSSLSYGLVPTSNDARSSTGKRQSLADFFGYALCQGQQITAQLGYAPPPLNLTRAGLQAVRSAVSIDPAVSTRALALSRCDNPTISHGADTDAEADGAVSEAPQS
jgi:phosphate transport system substrate-binding protein